VISFDEKQIRKEKILETSLNVFVKNGLENTSMRRIASACEIYASNMYEYFKSKDVLIIECIKLYMRNLNVIFQKELQSLSSDLKEEVRRFFLLFTKEKFMMRFIYQVVSSPKYGELGRRELSNIYMEYIRYSDKLAAVYGLNKDKFESILLLFVATIHDFCLWENEELANIKLSCIYNLIDKELGA